MQQMLVNPPAAAARAPVSMVSECSMPGSRRCTCMSMNPGATIKPEASNNSALFRGRSRPTAVMRPLSMSTSAVPSRLEAGSITRPPFTRREAIEIVQLFSTSPPNPNDLVRIPRSVLSDSKSRLAYCSAFLSGGFHVRSHHTFQNRHPHRHAVLHLVEDYGLLKIGDLGGQLAPAVDGPGVHHDGIWLGQGHVVQAQSVEVKIFARLQRRIVLPLQLHAQHHDDVGAFDGFTNIVGER